MRYATNIKLEYEVITQIPKEATPPASAFKWYIKQLLYIKGHSMISATLDFEFFPVKHSEVKH